MINLVYSPNWFYGKDLVIDAVSIVVLILISVFSIRYYRVDKKNKNYLYLASAFILMALSFLFKVITNFTIYYWAIETKTIGSFTLTYHSLKSSRILFFAGFLFYWMLMLIGLFVLYSIYSKPNWKGKFIIIYLILISLYFSTSSYYVFHMTSLVFLSIITLNYWQNYRKNKRATNMWIFYSFLLITFSQIFFIFIALDPLLYVTAEIVQIVGYLSLLITFIKVLKDGKEKRKKRHST